MDVHAAAIEAAGPSQERSMRGVTIVPGVVTLMLAAVVPAFITPT